MQDYLDELPAWPNGTRLKAAPMTGMQWRIWSLAAVAWLSPAFTGVTAR